jgi:hypothetical protein
MSRYSLGAGVALVLGQVVAVLGQFLVRAAGDDVDRDAAAGELVQRRQLAGGQGGSGEAWTVGDHEAQARVTEAAWATTSWLSGRGGVEGDQDAVEAAVLVGAGDALDIVAVDDRAAGRMDFRGVLSADKADEFDGHGSSSSLGLGEV